MVAIRMCVGCGVKTPQNEMLRLAHLNGQVVPDVFRRLPGRGAWIHNTKACMTKAIGRGAFSRALRVSSNVDTSLIENRLENTMDN